MRSGMRLEYVSDYVPEYVLEYVPEYGSFKNTTNYKPQLNHILPYGSNCGILRCNCDRITVVREARQLIHWTLH